MVANTIEREIQVAAPAERVWSVLTDTDFLGGWFGRGKPVDLDLRPGGLLLFDHGVHGALPCRIQAVESPRLLSLRWSQSLEAGSEPTDDNSTLVEITLQSDGDGTRVRFLESGFAQVKLPEDHLSIRYEQNSGG